MKALFWTMACKIAICHFEITQTANADNIKLQEAKKYVLDS